MGLLTKMNNNKTHTDPHEMWSQEASESRSIGSDEGPAGCAVRGMMEAAEMK